MKKIITLFTLLFFSNTHYALIIESNQLTTVLDYIKPNTLVIFDIDNTLAHPAEELGSDEWFSYKVANKMAEGCDEISAIYYALPEAFYAQFNIPMKPTEPNIPELIEQLVAQGIPVIALTTRSLFIAERTLEQLDNINIRFFIPGINPDDLVLSMPHPCFYKSGILFGGNNNKGHVLSCFLDLMNYHPENVIFVDDKMKYITAVEQVLQDLDIPFVGIRYSRCDNLVKNFDPAKSDAQLQALKQRNRLIPKHYKFLV